MYHSQETLFRDGYLDATLKGHSESAKEKVDNIPKDQVLVTPIDDIVEHISTQLYVEPLKLHEDSIGMDQKEIKIDVETTSISGIQVTVSIPYSGDSALWKLRPNRGRTTLPRAKIRQSRNESIGYADIIFEQASYEPHERIKSHLDRELDNIRFYVNAQQPQVSQHNSSIKAIIKKLVEARRERLHKQEGLSEFLNIPLKRNSSAPSIKPIDIQKKMVKPLPPAPNSGYKPEPGITSENYEHILSVIRHEGATFETTPKTYAVHDEEELRDIILAHLNGHYKGSASGETFRKSGKTDIRIEDENRAAFVAECKVWRGPNELSKALNQLLGYLTWRDCKAAIIIFNKHNARFSDILEKIPVLLRTHPKFTEDEGNISDNEWKFILRSEEDEARLVQVRIFAFNIFVPKSA